MKQAAVFGAGCFWCIEAAMNRLRGVESVISGYAGGETPNPTYEMVCTGLTGHAEVIMVTFDSAVIAYRDLLTVFFAMHDPTSLNKQGNDVGTEYRSVIFYADERQRKEAEDFIRELEKSETFSKPIVTEMVPLEMFYPAEAWHQKFYEKNPSLGYCQVMIDPKIAKLRQKFQHLLKSE